MRVSVLLWVQMFFVIAVLFMIPVQSTADVGQWTAFGPEGAYVNALERDPNDAEVVYAGVNNGGTFKSTDGGESWTRISGLPQTVYVIAFDPADGESIFAGGANGLYNSRDAGATWTEVGSELSTQPVTGLVIPVAAQENMLAGTRNGVFRSTDGGETWLPANTGLDSLQITLLSSDPSNPDIVYVAIHSYGMYKTVDGGSSWTAVNNGLSESFVYSIVVDPTNSNRVYAGTWNGGVFVSENGGSSWVPAGSDLAGSYVPALAIDPEPPHSVYAGTEGGLWASDDHGATWVEHPIGLPFDIVSPIALGPSGPIGMLAGTAGAGVFRSKDGEMNWKASSGGMIATQVVSLAVSHAHPTTVYAGTWWAGVYRSDNWGQSWKRASSGLENSNVDAIVVDPFTPDTVYAGTGSGVFKSSNGGGSWVEASAGMGSGYPRVFSLSIVGPSPGTVLAGTDRGVFRSVDGAVSWSDVSTSLAGLRVPEIAQGLAGSKRAYAGTESEGVFRSDDGGLSWVAANTGLDGGIVRALTSDPLDPDTAYVAVGRKIFKTVDGGLSWARIDTDLSGWNYFSLAFDPTDPEVLYASSNQVYRSDDSGESWRVLGSWGNYTWTNALAVDAVDGGTVFVGTYGGGVRLMTLPGRALWVPVVTHAGGLNSSVWRSDVWVLNPGDDGATVTLRFNGATGPVEDSFEIAAHSQTAFSDVVHLLGGSGSGALEITSETVVFAASRTYNLSGGGTFGQSYPASGIRQALYQGESAVLPQLAEDAGFRTNIGVVNIGEAAAAVNLELFDDLGTLLTTKAMPLQPGEWHLEVRPYWEDAGLDDLSHGWAKVTVQSGGGIEVLGSVIDNTSGDPTSIGMVRPSPSSHGDQWVPVVTHAPGLHQSQWRSDVALLNAGDETASATLRFFGEGGLLTQEENVGPGVLKVLGDVVDSFGTSGSGALEILSTQPLAVSSRTYNLSTEGTFGQSYPGVDSDSALHEGDSGYLLGLAENGDFRTNIGFANLGEIDAALRLELLTGAGEIVASYSLTLEPGEWRLEVRPFSNQAGLNDLDQGYARVTLDSGEAVAVLASVVDNRTNDPTTVALVR